MPLADALHQRQAQAEAAGAAVTAGVEADERLEDLRPALLGYARAVVADPYFITAAELDQRHFHPAVGVTNGVTQQR